MITANVICRVFRIAVDGQAGTMFTIDCDGKQYLITARHVAGSLVGPAQVSLFANGGWNPLDVQVVGHAAGDIDISVLAAKIHLTPEGLPLEASADGLIWGQDVHFLGFPYDILAKFILGAEGYPAPFVKGATLSAFDGDLCLLDGHNNPGFSGGPVVFTTPDRPGFRVAAVISGFKAVEEPILLRGAQTSLVYQYNTGIIVAYGISHAVDLIRSNPIGLSI